MSRTIHELRLVRGGQIKFVYFARIGGVWTDLAPFGNRLPQ